MNRRVLYPLTLWSTWTLIVPFGVMVLAALVVSTSDAKTLVFDNPQLWWLGAVVPLIGLVWLYGVGRRRRALNRFASAQLAPLLASTVSPTRQAVRAGLTILAVVMIVSALIGPRWGMYLEKQRVFGVEVVVALDVSRSMLAADLQPNRLERAKRDLRQQLTERGAFKNAHRLGLLAFAGTTSLRLPLTTDHVAFRSKLEALRVGAVPRGGTAIGQAIRAAVDLFAKSPQQATKVILLCTDGEDHEGDPVEEAQVALKEQGIRVFTIGVGDPKRTVGAEVPAGDGGVSKPLLHDGQIVFSRLDVEGLRKIAGAGGGDYASIEQLNRVVDKIANMRTTELTTEERMRHQPRYQWFVAVALLLLNAELMIRDVRPVAGDQLQRTWQQEGMSNGE